jgi:uncharacterized protein YqjF (DUF2071 family)
MTNVAPRGLRWLQLASAFAELNVRTYVTVGGKPGVWFFSLDAASALAVGAARMLFGLPYHTADMQVEVKGGDVSYRSRRKASETAAAAFDATYGPAGPARTAQPSTLEYFLTERYCLYVADAARGVRRLEIHHAPWPLQPAVACIEVNTMADAAGIPLPNTPPLLHFAKRLDVLTWGTERIE